MGGLRPFDLVAGVGGVVLLVALFLPWYGGEVTGWEALSVIDVLLGLAAVVAIAVPVVTAASSGPAKPVAVAVIASVLTALAVLVVAFRLVDDPGPHSQLRSGAWIGLVGALIAFAGAFGALKDESTPGAVPPDVPRRPAPPAAAA
jgi:hypothetical protein